MFASVLTSPWRALKKICEDSFVVYLAVWFWFLGPLFYTSVVVILMILAKLYWIVISYPSRILRRCFYRSSQLTSEIQGSIFYSLGIARPYSFVQDLIWMTLESDIADDLAIVIRSTCTSLQVIGVRMGEWLGSQLVTILFYIPRGVWIVVFTMFGSLIMLGGAGTAVLLYWVVQAVNRETFGLDYLNEQRLKLERNKSIYQQLVPGQIRVLYLYPGLPGSPIRCGLKTTKLDATRYEALSYVWGNPTMDRSIFVNEERVSITRNLHRALTHLRHETELRVLWVDALCINQIDIGEREAQVSQMCNIYGYASRVVVWLNIAPFGTKQAFQAAQRDKPSSSYHFGTVRVISKLLASPWWMRVWVVQEFIVAKAVIIQCSSHTLDWDDFCGLVDSAIRSPCFVPNGTYLDEYRALREQRSSRTLNASGNDLLELLFAFRMKHATDPRDKIFAFLALSNTGEAQGDDNTVVRADYVTNSDEVFQDCAVKLINASKSLSILALAECVETSYLRKELAGRFTWCPQWSSYGNNFRVTPFWTGPYNYNQPWAAASRFSAAGGIPAPPCLIVDDMLRISGWAADEVVAVGQTADISWDEFIEMFEQGAESSKIIAALDAWRHWEKVLSQWKELAETSSGLSRDISITRKVFHTTITAGLYPELFDVADDDGLTSAIRTASYGRTFFVTASGLFGLGPCGTVPGDKVYVLLGSDVPVILRQVPNPMGRRRENAMSTTDNLVPPQLYVG